MEDKILEFKYEEKSVLIQCNTKEKMKEIINKFSIITRRRKRISDFFICRANYKRGFNFKRNNPY